MAIEHDTRTAPAHWCSFLFYGDASGMDDADAYAAALWETALADEGWRVTATTTEHPWFAARNDALGNMGCDIYAYCLMRVGGQ